MGIWVDVAQLVGGAAAVAAIIFGILDRRRHEYADDVSRAAGITAWRAIAEAVGEEEQIRGVVIENASNEVATTVDVKAGKLAQGEGRDFASQPDKIAKGLRLALLPQGTWFVPLDGNEWKAQIEVDDASGARSVLIPESSTPGAQRTRYQLFPVAKIEENVPAVHLLRFKLSSAGWWRDSQGILHEDAKKGLWRSMRMPSPNTWDQEFSKSATTERGEATRTSDHSKYVWEGDGPRLGKFDIINLIAAWWAEKEGLRTVEEFERRFGDEIQKAAPALASKYGTGELLTDTPATVKNDGNPKNLGLDLDGTPYGIQWACGIKGTPKIGLALHKPIIEHFRAEFGAPATPSE